MKHLVSVNQLDRKALLELCSLAGKMKKMLPDASRSIQPYKRVATLFYEPSTRTRLSFEAAAQNLGMDIISTENAMQFSSAAKGETLEDTIRVVGGYCDAIVIRHPETGAAEKAASVSTVPIINAGDGTGEHPTQALLDLFTIKSELKKIDGIKVALIGDLLNGRTVHSLVRILAHFKNVELYFISPSELSMPKNVLDQIKGVKFHILNSLDSILEIADVFYVTRIQKERFTDQSEYQKFAGIYCITAELLNKMKNNAIIMHPLPRVGEIDPIVDNDPRAAYFRQAENGLYMRMAILSYLLADS